MGQSAVKGTESVKPNRCITELEKKFSWPAICINDFVLCSLYIGTPTEAYPMIKIALILLIFALIAAAFGFGGLAGAAIGFAQILFFVFLLLFALAFILDLRRPKI